MKIGTIFEATNKLGITYKYQLEDINPSCKMREYVLNNLTLDCVTEVELEWFNQRKISVKTYDENAVITGSRIGENVQGSKVLYITYRISKEYARKNELYHRDREIAIIMERASGDESAEQISYALVG